MSEATDRGGGAAANVDVVRDTLGTPGVGFARFGGGGGVEPAVRGVRAVGGGAVTTDDLWHFGSIGKSMTAAVAEALVAAGAIAWDTTIDRVLPEARHSAFAQCTLRDTLAHRSGMRTDPPWCLLLRYIGLGASPDRISTAMLRRCLASRPVFEPGSDFLYSNAAYGVAGLMLERASGDALPTLIHRHVLVPAGMTTARVAVPPQDGSTPLEHEWRERRRVWRVIQHGRRMVDDLSFIKPSGCVTGAIQDLAAYGLWQLERAIAGQSVCHQPVGPPPEADRPWRYGLGWMLDILGDEPCLWHSGSTGGCFALLAIIPTRRAGIVVVANGFRPGWGLPGDSATQRLLDLCRAR